jgi:ribosomal protein S12 methylthiotransferase accessory factor
MRAAADEPMLLTRVDKMGDVSQIWLHTSGRRVHGATRDSVQGAGAGLDEADVVIRSRGEGLERYCASIFDKNQFVLATANELGMEAMDLDQIPRCSPTELADPRCPLVAPDKNARIRWVRGLSLLDGRPVYVPAVMVYLYAGMLEGERFWLPISTGCAAHTSLEGALVGGILECAERDIISVAWLQRLTLPRLRLDVFPELLATYWERYQRSSCELEYVFFDATTDLGIPTVYALQTSLGNRRLTTLVSCSTALSGPDAVVRVMREMASCRIALRQSKPIPEKVEDFSDILHGASYMARPEQASAFEFLLHSPNTRNLSEMPDIRRSTPREVLQLLLSRLRERQMDAIAVELSTDEALRAGVRVVRVLIPKLQPVAFNFRARYLAHSRLYELPAAMGYSVSTETELNHWPQPFA